MKLSDNPNDPLYRRCAEALCGECGSLIADMEFELVYSEVDGVDGVVCAGVCAEEREREEG